MKTLTLRFRARDKANFNLIKSGIKTIETRAATEKYKNIKAGDLLRIVCDCSQKVNSRREVIRKRVKRVRYFKNITSMLRAIPGRKINPKFTSVAAAENVYYGYPGYREKIKKFGLVALYI